MLRCRWTLRANLKRRHSCARQLHMSSKQLHEFVLSLTTRTIQVLSLLAGTNDNNDVRASLLCDPSHQNVQLLYDTQHDSVDRYSSASKEAIPTPQLKHT